jgi:predicted aspartyl protease
MIRYNYTRQVNSPAPFVHVTLHCPESGKSLTDLVAQVDCGADRTVIPERFVEQLGLVQLDEMPVAGFGGQVLLVATYALELAINSLSSHATEVFAHCEEPYILLGRDVLNRHRLLLDGPSLTLELD